MTPEWFEVMMPEPNPSRRRSFFANIRANGALHIAANATECPAAELPRFVSWLRAHITGTAGDVP